MPEHLGPDLTLAPAGPHRHRVEGFPEVRDKRFRAQHGGREQEPPETALTLLVGEVRAQDGLQLRPEPDAAVARQCLQPSPLVRAERNRLSLERNAPTPRDVELPGQGEVVAVPVLGGLHHRYSRRAA